LNLDKMPFHIGCREGWGCSLQCPVRQLLDHARGLEQEVANLHREIQKKNSRKKMDAGTTADMVEDLQIEIAQLHERIRQIEAERDQWQTKAVSND